MTEEMMLATLDAATALGPWWVAYYLDGTEIAGGSYARQPISFAASTAVSETVARAGSSNDQTFTGLPTTDVDEARIVNTASGAITLTGWILPYLRSFTAGAQNTHAADDIAVGYTTS